MDAVDLYDRTIRPRDAVAAAREWLLDLAWADQDDAEEQIRLLNAVGVIAAVEKYYDGGWVAFATTEGLWDGRTPRERDRDVPLCSPDEEALARRVYGDEWHRFI